MSWLRRLAPASSKGRIAVAIVAVLVLALGAGVPAGLGAVGDLRAARTALEQARDSARKAEVEPTLAALDRADATLEAAIARLGGPALLPVRLTPVVGGSVGAVRDLATASRTAIDGAREALEVLRAIDDAEGLDGLLALDWPSFEAPLERAHTLIGQAVTLAESTQDAWMPGSASAQRADAISQLQQLRDAARDAVTAAGLMGRLLDGRPRHVMIVIQNSADLRATGGFPDQFVVLRLGPSGADVVGSFSDDPLPENYPFGFVDWHEINKAPDFAAAAWKFARVGREVTGRPIDLVMALDTVAVGALLGAIGSITVDGRTVTGDNYLSVTTREIYEWYPESRVRQTFEDALVATFMDKLFSPSASLTALLPEIGPLVAGKHLQAWSGSVDMQEALEALGVGGRISRSAAVVVGVFGNQDTSGGRWTKVWPWVHRSISYTLEIADGRAQAIIVIEIRNEAPAGLPERALGPAAGHAITQLLVYGLDGATPRRVEIDVPLGETVRERLEGSFEVGDGGIALVQQASLIEDSWQVTIRSDEPMSIEDDEIGTLLEITDPRDQVIELVSAG